MRNSAARLVGARHIGIFPVAAPEPVPGSVVVEIDRCAIADSDIEAWRTGVVDPPAWFGHEWVGRVAAMGAGVSGRFEGERVTGATCAPCGTCAPCRAGLGSNCEVALALIVGGDPLASPHGAFAHAVRVDARRLQRVPEGIDDDDAVLAEPAATAVHAAARAGLCLGDIVAVVGAGTIGLLVTQLAHLGGAGRVVNVDADPAARELACTLGADAAFAAGEALGQWLAAHGHGLGADLVFECSGKPDGPAVAVPLARPGGTVVLVGVSSRAPRRVPAMGTADVVASELTIRASRGYGIGDVRRALELMADERLRVGALRGSVVGFDGLAEAFGHVAAETSAGRVLLAPRL